MRIEKLSINVTVEGDAEEGERAFARLFDKYSDRRHQQMTDQNARNAKIAQDRLLSPDGGRS